MKIWKGEPVSEGTAQGPALVWKKQQMLIERQSSCQAEKEIERVKQALALSGDQIRKLCQEAEEQVGEEHAAIFEVHLMMLEDEELLDSIFQKIRLEQMNAEYAVSMAGGALSDLFAGMDDEYMKARSLDVDDITDRLIRNLMGVQEPLLRMSDKAVVLTEKLTPSEILKLDREKTLGLVTVHGSVNSHTAILARAMKIPAVTNLPLPIENIRQGTIIAVDGTHGEAVIF